jgi:hypothetical protein
MRLNRRTFTAAIGFIGLAVAIPASAHKAPRVETSVVQTESGALEVTHALQLTAAQRVLHDAGVLAEPDLSTLRAQAQTALYAAENFALQADGAPVPLTPIGAEIIGAKVYVYQTGEISDLPAVWTVTNTILRSEDTHFHNAVNLPTRDGLQTLTFEGAKITTLETTE